eukprot:jgi/Picre1/32886/NNA_008215.t1
MMKRFGHRLMQQGTVLLRGEAATASENAGWMSVGFGGLNARMASSHAENTNQFISEALEHLEYPEKLQKMLLAPEREVSVELEVLRDSGEVDIYKAYRVQHCNSRGPYKGGLRYHPQVDLDDVRSLASLMTWKTAVMDIPLGEPRGASRLIRLL